ncbi:G-type lectin S-receptor-like serine/threonine-protein kinase At4g27290 [Camellia sinensis]|uniref:G-type lectin S-receptor-like serine/threonine-protein kinase At4g27290 n=1 Tax=Camellia sinensis TaxID=4442 RepID=UPI0010359D2B|nr:G-type lectin S-receptor-like serine/threonine-protein kinase At4g27290 [Camellia sinensis]
MGCFFATILHISSFFFFSILILSNAMTDTITANQTIGVTDTIVSFDKNFELGFFTPGNSNNFYLAIWYKKISTGTIAWVANRARPLTDLLGVLKITNPGILLLLNSTGNVIWSSNSSTTVQNPVAQLFDNGNLVVRDGDQPENILWQSFDYPTATFLPGMKLGKNFVSGLDRYLTSWRSIDDPSPGNFTYQLDPTGYPQMIVRTGSIVKFRSGPWNGLRFSGLPMLNPNSVYTYGFISNREEMYFQFHLVNSSVFTRLVLSPTGLVQRFTWVERTHGWVLYSSAQTDNCDSYGLCGPYGNCIINRSPPCWCLDGFQPRFPTDWEGADWSGGCDRAVALECSTDGFVKYSGVKLPDTRESWFNESMSLVECRTVCLKNCSCMGYTSSDIRGEGSGCLVWFGDLIDLREFNENGQVIYIRMAASETSIQIFIHLMVIAASVTFVGILLLEKKNNRTKDGRIVIYLFIFYIYIHIPSPMACIYAEENQKEFELPLFELATIANATKNFSEDNKIGEGGFGPVYKGILMEGQEIAVKRLSENSRQGLDEFKNEVIYIAKLQHRNLVKLLGCCIEVEEKLLIYEYMSNKSLDYFIFDQKRSMLLDWPKRFNIIVGIARGLLYLHQDSRLRIIHRDLKVDNILLDNEMNPKISDFGIAKSFDGNETEAKTNKVVGTHGYISPEYAVHGVYSVKSDVFSFGVLVLEILSGKRNREFDHPDHHLNLLGHAWKLYIEGRPLELVDELVRGSWFECEVLRSIHVGLLCVQQYREDRPSMSTVTMMLGGEGVMPRPKQPAFFGEESPQEVDSSSESKNVTCSTNEVTITELKAR